MGDPGLKLSAFQEPKAGTSLPTEASALPISLQWVCEWHPVAFSCHVWVWVSAKERRQVSSPPGQRARG